MLQSSENINSFTFPLDLLKRQEKQWVWPEVASDSPPLEKWTKYLRYPEPKDGVNYWVVRWGVITTLSVLMFFRGVR